MIFRQLHESLSSTYTYLLGDEDTGHAVLIDPAIATMDRDLAEVRRVGLTLACTVDTHNVINVSLRWRYFGRSGAACKLSMDIHTIEMCTLLDDFSIGERQQHQQGKAQTLAFGHESIDDTGRMFTIKYQIGRYLIAFSHHPFNLEAEARKCIEVLFFRGDKTGGAGDRLFHLQIEHEIWMAQLGCSSVLFVLERLVKLTCHPLVDFNRHGIFLS